MAARDPETGQYIGTSSADTELRRATMLVNVESGDRGTYTMENNDADRMIRAAHVHTNGKNAAENGALQLELSESAVNKLSGIGGDPGEILAQDLDRSPVIAHTELLQRSADGFCTVDDPVYPAAVRWGRGEEIHLHVSNNLGTENAVEVIVWYEELE